MSERVAKRKSVRRDRVPSLREQIYSSLKAMILTGELRPGSRLSERDLASRLSVSRTPLREALSRLAQEKLAKGRPNRGYVVAELDYKAIKDLIEVRVLLDAYAASMMAESGSEEDFEKLRACLAELETVLRLRETNDPDFASEITLGVRIHEIIAESTGNQVLVDTFRQICSRLQMAMYLEVLWVDPWEISLKEHRDIVEAICNRDPVRSAEVAREHVRRSFQNMMRVTQTRHKIAKISYAERGAPAFRSDAEL